jgi:hypothetical protein
MEKDIVQTGAHSSGADARTFDRRKALKIGLVNISAIAAATAYRKPSFAANAGTNGLSPVTQSYIFQRQYPDTFFPTLIAPDNPGCNPSQYAFSGTIEATTQPEGTIAFTNIDLTGTYQSGDDLGVPRVTNVGDLNGVCDPQGNFSATGTLRYVDQVNPVPGIVMGNATFTGKIWGPTSIQIALQGSGAGFCAGSLNAFIDVAIG